MYILSSVVAVPGPPSVRQKIKSNVLKLLMMSIISTKKWLGVSIGNVMRRKRWNPVAPSIMAASCSSGGTSCSAAR